MRRKKNQRRGTTMLEFAVALPVVFFVLTSIIVVSFGVFRYHQVAALAREGSRWASVHGADYEDRTGNPAATADDVFENAILPVAMTMDRERLSHEVTWDQSNEPLQVTDNAALPFGNKVTVTVRYQWIPEFYFAGPVNIESSSTSKMIH